MFIMIIRRLLENPPSKILIMSIIIGFVLCFIGVPITMFFYELSGFPEEIILSQLSFSGSMMKSYYSVTEIEPYRMFIAGDYMFMTGYGLILFSTSVIIARRFGASSILCVMGFFIAIFGIIAACCDGIENLFILLMLTDPLGFPNWWAITHSVFALIKWVLLIIVLFWVIIFGIMSIFKKKT